MKILITIIMTLLPSASFGVSHTDPMLLLDRDLGTRVEVKTQTEIWYCPDNTCEMFRAAEPGKDLPAFIYLYLFHKSGYIYLNEKISGPTAFRKVAIEEPLVRERVGHYCTKADRSPSCILEGMKKMLKIEIGFGRYDLGNFCYQYSDSDNGCKKL